MSAIKEVDCSSLSFTSEIVKVARTTFHLFGARGGGEGRRLTLKGQQKEESLNISNTFVQLG